MGMVSIYRPTFPPTWFCSVPCTQLSPRCLMQTSRIRSEIFTRSPLTNDECRQVWRERSSPGAVDLKAWKWNVYGWLTFRHLNVENTCTFEPPPPMRAFFLVGPNSKIGLTSLCGNTMEGRKGVWPSKVPSFLKSLKI